MINLKGSEIRTANCSISLLGNGKMEAEKE